VALRLAILHPECTLPPRAGIWADLWEAELAGICAADARAGLGLRDTPQEKQPLPHQSQSELLAALEHSDWRVRARASDALVSRGEAEPVKGLVHDERLEVRAAAVQILVALGEEEWLEAALLAP
jgi:HEAT repeat protein